MLRANCLQDYHNKLKENVPKIGSYYDGYMKNFSAKDGSLIGSGYIEKEASDIKK